MPLIYVHKKRKNRSLMAEKKEEPVSQSKSLSVSDSSDDNEINPRLKTSDEDRQYNTIPRLAIATHIPLSYSRAQVNPTMERGPPHQKVKVNKSSAEKTKAKASDAQHKDKIFCVSVNFIGTHIDNSYSAGHCLLSAFRYKQ